MGRRAIVLLLLMAFVGVGFSYSQTLRVADFSYDKVPFFKRFKHKNEGDIGFKGVRVVDVYAPDDSCQYESGRAEITRIEGDGYSRLMFDKGVQYLKITHPSQGSFYWKIPVNKLKRWRGYKLTLQSSLFAEYRPTTQWLVISTSPRECVVRVDTLSHRVSDGRLQMQLPLGSYEIDVQAPFFEGLTDSVTLTTLQTLHYNVALSPIYSYLTVDSGSEQAQISIDGRRVGQGRVDRIRLAPGVIDVGVVQEGYEPYTQSVELQAQTSQSVSIDYLSVAKPKVLASNLEPVDVATTPTNVADTVAVAATIAQVQVQVKGYDANCDIYINNEFAGRGEWSGVLSGGVHAFDNRRDGFSSSPIFVEIGESPSIHVDLESPLAEYGVINLSTDIAGAQIFINGVSVGRSPMIIKNLQCNREYTVQVQLGGYKTQRQQVVVKANDQVKVEFKFNK